MLKDGTTVGTLQTIRIEWNMSRSPVTCQFTVVSSRHSCNRKVMSVTHRQVRPVCTTTTNIWIQTSPRTIGKICNIKTMHSKLFMKPKPFGPCVNLHPESANDVIGKKCCAGWNPPKHSNVPFSNTNHHLMGLTCASVLQSRQCLTC